MGTYLDFRIEDPSTDDSEWMARAPDRLSDSTIATEVNEWLREQPEWERLAQVGDANQFAFVEHDHREAMLQDGLSEEELTYHRNVGYGQVKMSFGGGNKAEVLSIWTTLFDRLHENFDIEVWSESGAFTTPYDGYFTPEQARTITDNGDALVGDIESLEELLSRMELGRKAYKRKRLLLDVVERVESVFPDYGIWDDGAIKDPDTPLKITNGDPDVFVDITIDRQPGDSPDLFRLEGQYHGDPVEEECLLDVQFLIDTLAEVFDSDIESEEEGITTV